MKLSILLIAIVLLGCSKKSDPLPTQLLTNSDMESGQSSPYSWISYSTGGSNFTEPWTTEEFNSSNHSLAIKSSTQVPTYYAYWYERFALSNLTGKNLVLSVKIKCINLSGEGASIAIGAYSDLNQPVQFVSTQNVKPIVGNFDWTTYQVKLPNIDKSVKFVAVFLIMGPENTGTIYFDDASLTY
jgi:hypothetical protein